LNCFIYRVSIY